MKHIALTKNSTSQDAVGTIIALAFGPQMYGATPLSPDPNTVVLDHFEGVEVPDDSQVIGRTKPPVRLRVAFARLIMFLSVAVAGLVSAGAAQALTFADQIVNTQSPAQTVTVTNPGSLFIIGFTLTISSPDFVAAGGSCSVGYPMSLSPSSSCTLSVAFLPRSAGAKTGTIYYQSSQYPYTKSALYTLTGTGVAAPPCTFSISPTSQTFAAAGGTGSVSVTTASGCAWTAASSGPIVILSNESQKGSGVVSYRVPSNTSPSGRTLSMTIAGKGFSATQAAACSWAISPGSQTIAPSGGSGTVKITTSSGCSWTASSGGTVTIVSGGSGTNSGALTYSVPANATGVTRNLTLTIAGATFTISQASEVITPVQLSGSADTLLGTFTANAYSNAGGCPPTRVPTASSDGNPSSCLGPLPGPVTALSNAPAGTYRVVTTGVTVNGGNPRVWVGNSSSGTGYYIPATVGSSIAFNVPAGSNIVIYTYDWYAYDNDQKASTTVQLFRSADTLLGTFTANAYSNAGGCPPTQVPTASSDGNPSSCLGPLPGPVTALSNAPAGTYRVVTTGVTVNGGNPRVWVGNSSSGTGYYIPATVGSSIAFNVPAGSNIVIYTYDWYAYDNDQKASTTVQLFRSADTLLGTFTANAYSNAGGCPPTQVPTASSDGNPSSCLGPLPGPVTALSNAPAGTYRVVTTGVTVNGGNPRVWVGNSSSGTGYYIPATVGSSIGFNVPAGSNIVFYTYDWYAYDNDPKASTTVELFRVHQ